MPRSKKTVAFVTVDGEERWLNRSDSRSWNGESFIGPEELFHIKGMWILLESSLLPFGRQINEEEAILWLTSNGFEPLDSELSREMRVR